MAFSQDPDAPLITYVSVNHSTQQVDINWVNTTTDVVGYVIYFQDISGLWIPLDTIMGINNTILDNLFFIISNSSIIS